MRKILATGSAVIALMGAGMGAASATSPDSSTVYDGTRDSYVMENITHVYAVGEFGTEAYFPALTMDSCAHEDGTGAQCVWHAPSRGMGHGASYVQLNNGGEFGHGQEIAYISHEAARVLLKPSEAPAPSYGPEVASLPVEVVPPVVEPLKPVPAAVVESAPVPVPHVAEVAPEIVPDPENMDDIVSEVLAEFAPLANQDHEGMSIEELEEVEPAPLYGGTAQLHPTDCPHLYTTTLEPGAKLYDQNTGEMAVAPTCER